MIPERDKIRGFSSGSRDSGSAFPRLQLVSVFLLSLGASRVYVSRISSASIPRTSRLDLWHEYGTRCGAKRSVPQKKGSALACHRVVFPILASSGTGCTFRPLMDEPRQLTSCPITVVPHTRHPGTGSSRSQQDLRVRSLLKLPRPSVLRRLPPYRCPFLTVLMPVHPVARQLCRCITTVPLSR